MEKRFALKKFHTIMLQSVRISILNMLMGFDPFASRSSGGKRGERLAIQLGRWLIRL